MIMWDARTLTVIAMHVVSGWEAGSGNIEQCYLSESMPNISNISIQMPKCRKVR